MENNNEESKLKIVKINKLKKEKNIYNLIRIIVSIVSGFSILLSGSIIYEGIKGNGKYGPLATILSGALGLLVSVGLGVTLNKEGNRLNKEYQSEILKLEEDVKIR